MKNNEIEQTNSRRSFMKKAAYAVPTVIAISQLTSPMTAAAASKITGSAETNPTNTAAGTDRGDAYNLFGKK
jgi:cytosine/uracil/thiamine/allantoin permease